ncbi:MAG TPA: LacI family DNA-binding transcriptional regulator [Candidatus Didemnitutus sp.]|nr:LacI family DNA-binding transcriptional regulator [Candidatus Didemnitutus sp.]
MPRLSKKNRETRAPTLADVGRAAGVSAMAASAVLNGAQTSSRISDATRARILKAAAKLQYRPNAAARALANRRMQTLGVAAVVESGGINPYFMEVLNGILEAAARHEQNITVFALHDWSRDATRIQDFCDGRIDGLILLAPTFEAEKVTLPPHTPFVSVHANSPLPGIVNVESDEERGAFEMVRHLGAQGHRRIMHIAGPSGMIGAERRVRGYKRALTGLRIPFDARLLAAANYTSDGGREAMRAWLRRHAGEPLPHAVFCANDATAIGCLEALAEVGLKVPDDISVAGFDDTLAARTAVPQLTTVKQPLRSMGIRAAEVLLQRIAQQNGAGGTVSVKPIIFPVDLVPRNSVGSPPVVERLVPAVR